MDVGVFDRFQSIRIFLGLVNGLMLVSLQGCTSSSHSAITLLVSGDTQGWITPCGCAANQSGGLARRATVIADAKKQGPVLMVDVGGSAVGSTEYQRLKFESLLRGMQQMGVDVCNVGGPETVFGPQELAEISQSVGVTWLSCNLKDAGGTASPTPVRSIEINGTRIAIVGVVDPALVEHSDWQVSDPLPAILNAFRGVDADIRVVLAYLDEGPLRALASSLPEVDYVIGGPTGQTISPVRIGEVTLMSATNKGKFLAEVKWKKDGDDVRQMDAQIIEVSSRLMEDPAQLRNLKDYYQRLSEQDFVATESGLANVGIGDQQGYSIAGSEACKSCHTVDDAIWHQSKHSHAWDVLVAKQGAQFDPQCQQCHTTGYAQQGGFQSVAESTHRVHVGCENCHGPSQSHVLNPKARTPFLAKEQCLNCHDHENSPEFDYSIYWARIAHSGLLKESQ
jgi:hypothetical protein